MLDVRPFGFSLSPEFSLIVDDLIMKMMGR